MIASLINVFKIPELRRKILFTLLIIAIYRLGMYVPIPGTAPGYLESFIQKEASASGGGFFLCAGSPDHGTGSGQGLTSSPQTSVFFRVRAHRKSAIIPMDDMRVLRACRRAGAWGDVRSPPGRKSEKPDAHWEPCRLVTSSYT